MKITENNIKINTRIKLVIIFSLAAAVTVLAILYFSIRETAEQDIRKTAFTPPQKQLTADEMKPKLSAEVDSVLFMFGIRKEWIKERDGSHSPPKTEPKSKQEPKTSISTGNLWFSKEISVPKDLPTAEVNLELTKHLSAADFGCTGSENPKSGAVTLDIYHLKDSSRKKLANIIFIPTDKIRRNAADVCFILDNTGSYSNKELENILGSNENFSVILPDQIDQIEAQTIVMDSKRDYLLKVRIGTEDEITSEFRTDMSDKELKIKVRTTCYEYDKAAGVIIVNPKKIHKTENELLYEFSKYRLKAFKDTSFIRFGTEESGAKKIDMFFRDIKARLSKGSGSIIYILTFTPDEFELFSSESYKIKRLGYRFFTFSDIIKRRTRAEIKDTEEVKE